jgi:oxygen-independent coproporphyrinogen-3 oxidase
MPFASCSPPVSTRIQRADAKAAAAPAEGQTLAVYIHWPFCRSKCPYCDFNSHVREAVDERRWCGALLRELRYFAEDLGGRQVVSVFFGGGTPSLMAPATVATVIDAIAGLWTMAEDVEITLEANPTSADAGRFAGFRLAGVNRLSIGVQALRDAALAQLGRTHSAAEARAAVGIAAQIFPRYSIDLIYGRPGQTVADWHRELTEALSLAGEHLSPYQLTIEAGTAFHRRGIAPAEEETACALYQATQEILADGGLAAYEISNHARPGGHCRHNLAIWRGADYLGTGPGAHGRLTDAGTTWAVQQIRSPDGWLTAMETRGHAIDERRPLALHERREELLLMGLRLSEGLDRCRFRELTGAGLEEALSPHGLAAMVDGGFVMIDDNGLRATAAGRLCLDAVLARLLL